MKTKNGFAGAGCALKRGTSKGERQRDQAAIRQGLMEKAEAERLAPLEAFQEVVEEMGIPMDYPRINVGDGPAARSDVVYRSGPLQLRNL